MKKFLPLTLFAIIAFASTYAGTPITLSGFNSDVVANGVGAASASTTHDVDSGNYVFLAPDYQLTGSSALPTVYLPGTGLINSVNTSGLAFQLAAYTGLNNLRLQTTNSGVLTFGTPTAASVVYLLGCSGSGSSTALVTVKFSDNSTQTFNVTFNDWYGNAGYAITNVGRALRTTGATELAATNGPRLYEVPLALNPSNYSKQIVSITVARTGGSAANSILNVMAVTTTNATFAGGAYTINSTLPTAGSNYNSFTDAVSALTSNGAITGAVTFTVVPGTGPYNEQITIPTIAGASGTNRITFNCNGATMTKNITDANARSAILLNGADFITIDSLNIDVSAGTYGWGVTLTNQADSNIIRKCTINTSTTNVTSGNHYGIVISGSITTPATAGNNGVGNQFLNNTINGGYYGMYIYGNVSAYANNKGNKFIGNTVKDFYTYGVYFYGQDSLTVSKSDISRPTRATVTTTYGLYISTNTNVLVEKNKVHNLFDGVTTSTSVVYCIYNASSGTSASQMNRFENNQIYNINNGGGSQYGFYALGYNFINYYHNTVVLDHAASTAGVAYGMYVYGSSVNVKNNIVHITRGGTGTKYCLYLSTTGVTSCNNNNLYLNAPAGTNYIGFYNAGYTTFSAWQAANSAVYDANSYSVDAAFVSAATGDLKPTAATLNDVGAVGLGVTTDILDATRTTNPDPGSVEFQLPPCTNPATAGTTVASATNVCNGQIFSLNLSGNSIGAGLVYQWQSCTTAAGTYTNVGGAGTNPLLSTSQTSSFYYRCAVTCSSGATVYSNAIQVTSPALVSGISFTINNTMPTAGTNFNSFTDAVNYIKCGINGPVTFTVTPGSGPYNDSIILPQIFGASNTNKVIFRGNGATLSFNSTNANYRGAVILNGADFVTIDSLTIDVSASSVAGYGVILTNQADSNVVTKCTIINTTASTSTNYCGIVLSGSTTSPTTAGNSGNGNTISLNTITGGYYSIVAYGASGIYIKNNVIANNTVKEFYIYGIYTYYCDSLTIRKNDISRPTRTAISTLYGIYPSSCTNLLVEKNTVHNCFDAATTSTASAYPIYIGSTGVSAAQPNRVENNLVYAMKNGGGLIYGIYGLGYNNTNYYHNTVVLDDAAATAGTTYGMYVYGTAVNVKNNIVQIARGGTGAKYCLYFSTTGVTSSNNNNLQNTSSAGTNGIGYFNAGYTTLATWQAANGAINDANSVSIDPVYANASIGDYKPTASTLNNLGTPVGVERDILDSSRSNSVPDMGAYEFSTITAGLNFGAETLISPAVSTPGCYLPSETVTVRIRNSGASTHNFVTNPVTVNVNVTGAVTQTLSAVVNTGTLASDGTLNVNMSTTLNMSTAGTYTFNASTTLVGDVNSSNDAMLAVVRTKNTLSSGTITVSPTYYCGFGATAPTLTATTHTGYSGLQWQISNTSGSGYTDVTGATTSSYTYSTPITATKYFRLVATCGTGTNNSAETTVNYVNPTITGTTPATRCGSGVVNLSASASSGATVKWYAASSGGLALASGNSFTTPSISTTTNYYVAAASGGNSGSLGLANAISTTGNTGYTDIGLVFDATVPFILQSVAIYPIGTGGAATVTIDLKNASGTTIQSYTANVTTAAVPGVKTIVPLNFSVPAGNGQRLVVNGATGLSSLIRESSTANFSYPYNLAGVASITSAYTSGVSAIYYYYLYDWQITSGCESARTAVTATVDNSPSCVTPVSLLSFYGNKIDGGNKLSWITATELNNAGFELQRSADGTNFTAIKFIESKAINGNSNTNLAYDFVDTKTLAANNYYRLKQLDKDGKSSYSSIVLLKGSKPNALSIVNVYPNPVVNTLTVTIGTPINDKVTLVITDISGRVLQTKTINVIAGVDNNYTLDVSTLASGSYVIKAVCANGCESVKAKFVK